MIDITLVDSRYILTLPKCTLVLTRAEFIEALKRGKAMKRVEALAHRLVQIQPPTATK